MAIDLAALVALQKRRTQRAMDALAAAEAVFREAERRMLSEVETFRNLETSHVERRNDRIRGILQAPTDGVHLERIRLLYDVGEEEMAEVANSITLRQAEMAEAARKVEAAKAQVNQCMKREKKLEEAANRLSDKAARIAEMRAELELER